MGAFQPEDAAEVKLAVSAERERNTEEGGGVMGNPWVCERRHCIPLGSLSVRSVLVLGSNASTLLRSMPSSGF